VSHWGSPIARNRGLLARVVARRAARFRRGVIRTIFVCFSVQVVVVVVDGLLFGDASGSDGRVCCDIGNR